MYERFLEFFSGIWQLLRFRKLRAARNEPHPLKEVLSRVEGPFEAYNKVSDTIPWLKGVLIQEIQRFVQTQRSPHTARAYAGDLKQFVGYLRARNVGVADFDVLLGYRDWLVKPGDKGGAGLSRISANRKFSTIRAFLSWLQSRGKIRENPSPWVKNFRAKTESPTQAFSDEEVARILALPSRRSRSGRMHRVILYFLFYLGLRRGELVALKASHLGRGHLDGEEILTLRVPGKGDKERILPVPSQVAAALGEYLVDEGIRSGDDRFLFSPVRNNRTHVKEKPLNSHAIYYVVKKYARLAGVEARVSPHSCRATCISNALDHAASHRAVQQLAGWSSPLMIERYDKRRTDLRRSAVHVVRY